MADTLSAQLAGLYPLIYDQSLLALRAEAAIMQTARMYTDKIDVASRTFSSRSGATAASVAEGADLTSTTLTKSSDAVITPGEVGAQYILHDLAVRTDPTIWVDAGDDLGLAMAQKIDTDLGSTFSAFTMSIGTAGAVLDGGTAPAFARLFAAQAKLKNAGVAGPFWCTMHEYVWYTLSQSVSLEASIKNTPEVMREALASDYYVGSLGNFHMVTSSNIAIDVNNNSIGAMYPSSSLVHDQRTAPYIEPFRSPKGRKTELNEVAHYAYGVAHPARGCKITLDTKVPT